MSSFTQPAVISGDKDRLNNAVLKDKNGKEARILSLEEEDGELIAMLLLDDGQTARAKFSALEVDEHSMQSPHAFEKIMASSRTEHLVVPVVQEELTVSKHSVDAGKGIRIEKHVHERDEKIILPLVHENLSIEHVDIGTLVSPCNLPVARMEGDAYIIPILEEVVVLEKKILLKKEVRITRKKSTVPHVEKVRLRTEQISVERFDDKRVGDK